MAGALCRDRQSGKITERGIEIDERNRFRAAAATRRLGDRDEQGHSRRLVPQAEFFPVRLFAEMETVVRPQDNASMEAQQKSKDGE